MTFSRLRISSMNRSTMLVERSRGFLFDLSGDFLEPSLHVALRGGLQKLVQDLVHSVAVAGRRLVEHIQRRR